jgi:hypothetical protein
MFLTSCLKSLVLGKFPSNQGTGLGKLPTIPFSMNSSEIHDTQGCITSGFATTQELNEDLYLRRSYLTLFLNGTGYQESTLES